ncbi:MAG: 16S rRNA (cytosine(967)-C(5))-methyltransferase RsmB [Clostridia bacterium]|nr:16S rRNA (cytosine(967)-C(5))-methyltransferase RsmB [Clostridia bacterium]
MDQGNNKNQNQGGNKRDFKHRDGKPFEKKYDRKPGDKPFEKKFDRKPGDRPFEKKFERKPGEKPFEKKYDRKPGDRPAGKKFEGRDRRPAPAKPAGPSARDVALRALRSVARNDAYAAQALDRELSAAHLSDEDRRLAASIFYFTLENRLRIEHVLAARLKTRPEPEVMDILCIAAAQLLFMDKIPDHAAVDEAVKQARRAGRDGLTALVNGVLRSLIRDRDAGELTLPERDAEPEAYLSEKYSTAPELVARLSAAYGVDQTEEILAWSPDRRSDTIRPNRMRMSDAAFEAWLTQNGLAWEHATVSGAYRVTGAGKLSAHEGYRKGLFSIQGESSMLTAAAVGAKPGMQVLDACAAPGGKTCLIAETMQGTGRVYAWDLHEHRVELIRAAARRLELDNIRAQVRDAAKPMESMELSMDAVLVDAPCSGLGVMGDKPDIKYRLTGATIDALVPVQKSILNACASCVKPGGLLVYSTCTLLPEENEKQIEAFLNLHPEFAPDGDDKWLPEQLRAHYVNGYIQILPGRDGIEGFFIARLRRKAGSYER